MKKVITLDSEDDFVEVGDINTVKNLVVCVHPEIGDVGALTTESPVDKEFRNFMWRVTNGNGLFGGGHSSVKEAINCARTNGYEVRVLTSEDFDV